MGTLIAMAKHIKLTLNRADHTYVKCGTGMKAWGCWGGKTGGNKIGSGNGSTKRADAIAEDNERANIKCYAVNGVCHQAANRILFQAGILVRGARGYAISSAIYGTYGKVGFWPCKAPFKRYNNVTGDLKECVEKVSSLKKSLKTSLTAEAKLEWQYIKGVLDIYGKAEGMKGIKPLDTKAKPLDTKALQIELFMHMADFQLGPMLDKPLSKKLKQVRSVTEKSIVKNEAAFKNNRDKKEATEFVDTLNMETIKFQNEMASIMKPEQYETLFDLKPGENVILVDPNIFKKVYDIDLKALSKWYD